MSVAYAIVKGKCPRCGQGTIFQRFFVMHPQCPVCGLKFQREPGYFLGAMYISYFLSLVCLLAFFLPLHHFVHQPLSTVLGVSVLLYLPLAPFVFRYSRIVWIYIDRSIDP